MLLACEKFSIYAISEGAKRWQPARRRPSRARIAAIFDTPRFFDTAPREPLVGSARGSLAATSPAPLI